MKTIMCELCDSTDLVKDGAFFICQSCGAKYSVNEVKKMVHDGAVFNNSNTINTVSRNTSLTDNFLILAKNATEAGNHSEAEAYCNKIIEVDAKHSEAWLLKGRNAGWSSTLANMRLDEAIRCYKNALSFATEEELEDTKVKVCDSLSSMSYAIATSSFNHYQKFPTSENAKASLRILTNLLSDVILLIKENGGDCDVLKERMIEIAIKAASSAHYNIRTEYTKEEFPSKYDWDKYRKATSSVLEILMFLVNDPNSTSKDKIKCYKKLISIKEQLIESGSWTYSSSAGGYVMDYCYPDNVIEDFKLDIQKYHYEIKRLDPNYEIPQYTDDNGNNRIGGCYIATAVYGSYDCPEVWVLRRFRDNMLAKKWYGRMFIKTYYATSPTLVKFLGDESWFKYICKRPLDKLVKNLKLKGVKNTPYKDK